MKNIRKYLLVLPLAGVLLTQSCISYQPISEPASGTEADKVARFNYMDDNWSFINNGWITTRKVYPDDLVAAFHIPREQAQTEIVEFATLTRDHCAFRRFIIAIYFNQIDYYVK